MLSRTLFGEALWLSSLRRLEGDPVGRAKGSCVASLVSWATMAGVGLLCQSNRPFFLSGDPSWGEDAALSSRERVEVDVVLEEEEARFVGVEVEAKEVTRDNPLEEDGVVDEARKSVPKMSM